jgi:hypothetical protein
VMNCRILIEAAYPPATAGGSDLLAAAACVKKRPDV